MCYSLTWRQEDTLFRWYETRGVGEKGAVLVRPDRTVAWRAQAPPGDIGATQVKLELVLSNILGTALERRDSKQEFKSFAMAVEKDLVAVTETTIPAEVVV